MAKKLIKKKRIRILTKGKIFHLIFKSLLIPEVYRIFQYPICLVLHTQVAVWILPWPETKYYQKSLASM